MLTHWTIPAKRSDGAKGTTFKRGPFSKFVKDWTTIKGVRLLSAHWRDREAFDQCFDEILPHN